MGGGSQGWQGRGGSLTRRPATRDPGRNQRSSTSDPGLPTRPGHTLSGPDIVVFRHTLPGTDICQERDFQISPSIIIHIQHRFETNVFGKAVKESNYHCDGQCPSGVNDGFWIQRATPSFFQRPATPQSLRSPRFGAPRPERPSDPANPGGSGRRPA